MIRRARDEIEVAIDNPYDPFLRYRLLGQQLLQCVGPQDGAQDLHDPAIAANGNLNRECVGFEYRTVNDVPDRCAAVSDGFRDSFRIDSDRQRCVVGNVGIHQLLRAHIRQNHIHPRGPPAQQLDCFRMQAFVIVRRQARTCRQGIQGGSRRAQLCIDCRYDRAHGTLRTVQNLISLILRLPQQNEQCKDGEGQEPDDDRKEHPSFEK